MKSFQDNLFEDVERTSGLQPLDLLLVKLTDVFCMGPAVGHYAS